MPLGQGKKKFDVRSLVVEGTGTDHPNFAVGKVSCRHVVTDIYELFNIGIMISKWPFH
ncbi:hypothetical protein SAY87_004600 [Trapa incisa]|uniref:Uncharacterized protein n=1 Tax=Trapa incisa TaxID=236973 RepID=A0AAN7JU01_9MYRT|nr:hypothetical protein SAY87_004600 [Trapa incisa]